MTMTSSNATGSDQDATGITPEKVTVDLYGGKPLIGGGRETPLRAHEVWCSLPDSATACPFCAHGSCLCVTSGFSNTSCPYGKVNVTKGYTSRARKYWTFRSRYEEDPAYSALRHPSPNAFHVAHVGDYVAIEIPAGFVAYDPQRRFTERNYPRYGRDGNVIVSSETNSMFASRTWVPMRDMDSSVYVALCKLKPRRMLDCSVIKEYQSKVVPLIVETLRCDFPEAYDAVMEQLPELRDRHVDYRGKRALILTLRDGSIIHERRSKNNFVLDVESATLTCREYHNALILGLGSIKARGDATLTLHVGEKDEIEVEDNDWIVPGHTVFV